jgi:hypothetical protein
MSLFAAFVKTRCGSNLKVTQHQALAIDGTNMAPEDSPAKQAILDEWDEWSKEHPEDTKVMGGMLFFTHLQEKRADLLLDIRSSGDNKWRTVHSWLRRTGRVQD